MRGRRIKKLFDAINLLTQPCGCTIKELANRMEITERQAYRTVETLQDDFRFVIVKDQMAGSVVRYYIKERDQLISMNKMKVPDLNISLTEVISLYFLRGHAHFFNGTEIETEINRVFAKLDAFVPDGFEKNMNKIKTLFSSAAQYTKDYTDKNKIIDILTHALIQQLICSIEYHSFNSNKVKNIDIAPLKFFDYNGGLYIFIKSPSYNEIRTLAVERILSLTKTDKTFDYPVDFDPDDLLENSFGIIYDDPVTVKIKFSSTHAPYIKERRWAKNQTITESEDGSIIFSMSTSGWFDVKRWILSFGQDAEILEPIEMRNELRETAQQIQTLYS